MTTFLGLTSLPSLLSAPLTPRPFHLATFTSFALLQTTLLGLLLATRSWGVLLLNLICAGLWTGAAWFVRELEVLRELEKEGDRLRKERERRDKRNRKTLGEELEGLGEELGESGSVEGIEGVDEEERTEGEREEERKRGSPRLEIIGEEDED